MARNQRSAAAIPRANPIYPTYTPPSRPAASSADTYDSYEAEKNKAFKYVTFCLCQYTFCKMIERKLIWEQMNLQRGGTERQGNAIGQKIQNDGYV